MQLALIVLALAASEGLSPVAKVQRLLQDVAETVKKNADDESIVL